MSFLTRVFGKKRKKLNLEVTRLEKEEPEKPKADSGTTIRKPKEQELTALEMADDAAWEVKALPERRRGDVILDTYEIEDVFSGGMGHVYIAYHNKWKVKLAIKAPNEKMLSHRDMFARILREAGSWTDLGLHPNIAYCYTVRNIEAVPHIFIEYVDGGNLREWIEDNKCIDFRTNLDIAIQICHGMEYAHSKGMIHRDIKPENILMAHDGTPKITDFGLVSVENSTLTIQKDYKSKEGFHDINMTSIGTIMGSRGYMAPEQYHDPHGVDERADIFSFGIVLFEMFCGAKPYKITFGNKQEIPDPAGLSGIKDFPEDLSALLIKTVQWEPEDRYSGFEQTRIELNQIYQNLYNEDSPYKEQIQVDLKADGLNNRAISYLELGKREEAVRSFEAALEANPHHLEATFNYGYFRWNQGESYQDILEEPLLKLESVYASNPEYWLYRAWLMLERGEVDAIKRLQRSEYAITDADFIEANNDPGKPVARQIWSPPGHNGQVNAVAFSPDGRYALSGGEDNTVRLWEISTEKEIRRLEGHEKRVLTAAFSPDGKYILSGSADRNLILWDAGKREKIRTFRDHTEWVTSVAFSSDGRFAVSASHDKTIILWDIDTRKKVRRFEGHKDNVNTVAISSDGRYIVSGSDDKTLRVWELETGREVKCLTGHENRIDSVAISPDGRFAVSGGCGRVGYNPIKIWDLESGKNMGHIVAVSMFINSVAISPDGRYVISNDDDNSVALWDLKTKKAIRHFKGHTSDVMSVVFSSDGWSVMSGSSDCSVRVWDVSLGISIRHFGGHSSSISSVCFSSDGKYVLLGGEDKQFLSGTEDKHLRIWNIETGKEVRRFVGHSKKVSSARFSSDGSYIISGSEDKTVRLWEAHSGKEVRCFKGHEDKVTCISLSPDGRYVLSGSFDATLRLWNINSGQEVQIFKGHTSFVNSVAFSPDGRSVASGSSDNTLRVWDVKTAQEKVCLEGHTQSVTSVAYSNNNRIILSGSYDRTVRVWDIKKKREIQCFNGHKNESSINFIALTADGRYCLSCDLQNIKVWEVSSGKEFALLKGHATFVNSVALSPNGRFVISGSGDNTFRLWEISFPSPKNNTRHPFPVLCQVKPFKKLAAEKKEADVIFSAANDAFSQGQYKKASELIKKVRLIPGYENHESIRSFLNKCGIKGGAIRIGLNDGQCIKTFKGRSHLASVDVTPDCNYIVSGDYDGSDIVLWEVKTGKEVRRFKGYSAGKIKTSFSSDGKFILSCSENQAIRLWEKSTGKEVRLFKGHTNILNCNFSPDDRFVISGGRNGNVTLWETATGKEIRRFTGHEDEVTSVSFSSDGKRILSSSKDKTIKLWETDSGKELKCLTGHEASVNHAAFSPDDRFVVSGGRDHTIRMWETDSGKELTCLEHKAWGGAASVAFSPDGQFILSLDYSFLKIWDAGNTLEPKLFKIFKGVFESAVFLPDGHRVLSGGGRGKMQIHDIRSGEILQNFEVLGKRVIDLRSMAFSPDSQSVVLGFMSGKIDVLAIPSGKRIQQLIGHRSQVNTAVFSPDGKIIVSTAFRDKTVRLWNVEDGSEMKGLEGIEDDIYALAVDSESQRILTGDSHGEIRLWDVKTGNEIRCFNRHKTGIRSIEFSFDNKRILSGSGDGTVRLWETDTGKEIMRLEVNDEEFASAKFAPDGNHVLTASGSNLQLWDMREGKIVKRLQGHTNWVETVSFIKDSNYALSGSSDKTLRMWDIKTGEEVGCFAGHGSQKKPMALSPNGLYAISYSDDNILRLWEFEWEWQFEK